MAVTLTGIGNTLFNGPFTITVTGPMSFTVPNVAPASNATSGGGYVTPTVSAGDVFTDPVLIPFLNSGYRQLQYELANNGIETFIKDNVVFTLTPVVAVDPSVQVTLSDSGYNDGTNNYNPPQLPTDMLVPLRLWERQTGSTELWIPMQQRKDGLPGENQQQRLRYWEWRTDGLVFLGATQSEDIRVRYESFLPDVVQGTDPIQIRVATDAVAYFTAGFACQSRGSPAAAQFESMGEEASRKMKVRGVRRQQHTMHRRKPYGRSRSAYTPFF
jgi:hypothetical protein